MNRFQRYTSAALAAAAITAALAACGGASSNSSSTPAAPASPPAAAPATAAHGSAAPGTKLAVGRSATVRYTPLGAPGAKPSTLKVTVESLEQGTLGDFKGVQLDATQKASLPTYVKVKVTNLGPSPIDVDGTSAAIQGLDNTGNTQQSVTFIGDFPRCPDHASTTQMGPGSSYDNCLTFLVPGGIRKVAYTGTEAYVSSPVTWSGS
jgi:hypothetical protein